MRAAAFSDAPGAGTGAGAVGAGAAGTGLAGGGTAGTPTVGGANGLGAVTAGALDGATSLGWLVAGATGSLPRSGPERRGIETEGAASGGTLVCAGAKGVNNRTMRRDKVVFTGDIFLSYGLFPLGTAGLLTGGAAAVLGVPDAAVLAVGCFF